MRDIKNVTLSLIEAIGDNDSDLLNQVKDILRDLPYYAPESTVGFERLSYLLMSHFHEVPVDDWEYECCSILSDRSIDSIRDSIQTLDSYNYTLKSAVRLMRNGVKMTHRYFNKTEWAVMNPIGVMIRFEDGAETTLTEFLGVRITPEWNNNWYKFPKH